MLTAKRVAGNPISTHCFLKQIFFQAAVVVRSLLPRNDDAGGDAFYLLAEFLLLIPAERQAGKLGIKTS
jgi:hypothetical protein